MFLALYGDLALAADESWVKGREPFAIDRTSP
jgi:hypothetical protein